VKIPVVKGATRILDFDVENRPTTYRFPEPWAQITSIAAAWVDDPKNVRVWLLGIDNPDVMLAEFLEMFEEADMVTGHYIRKHDLPIINEALVEIGMKPLGVKMTQDTKLDLVKKKTMPATQKDLAEMLGVRKPKVDMSQVKWREANNLTEAGLVLTYKRVAGDVRQHIAMRRELLKRGLLKSPRPWHG
jgi:predicted PolB exonuclease-like 3'-5' exonuclease